jgi:hypothetical protein
VESPSRTIPPPRRTYATWTKRASILGGRTGLLGLIGRFLGPLQVAVDREMRAMLERECRDLGESNPVSLEELAVINPALAEQFKRAAEAAVTQRLQVGKDDSVVGGDDDES